MDSKIEAPRPPLSSHDSSGGGARGSDEKRNAPSTVRVKKLSRGKSDEGDKLLDYLVSVCVTLGSAVDRVGRSRRVEPVGADVLFFLDGKHRKREHLMLWRSHISTN